MRSLGVGSIVLALALVGCGEASPADIAAMEATDGGASAAYLSAISVPECEYDAQMGSITATACDPSTSATIDTGIPSDADGGADFQTVVTYYSCTYQSMGTFAQKCIAGAGVNSFTRLTAKDPTNRAFLSIGYCVDKCPAIK